MCPTHITTDADPCLILCIPFIDSLRPNEFYHKVMLWFDLPHKGKYKHLTLEQDDQEPPFFKEVSKFKRFH